MDKESTQIEVLVSNNGEEKQQKKFTKQNIHCCQYLAIHNTIHTIQYNIDTKQYNVMNCVSFSLYLTIPQPYLTVTHHTIHTIHNIKWKRREEEIDERMSLFNGIVEVHFSIFLYNFLIVYYVFINSYQCITQF